MRECDAEDQPEERLLKRRLAVVFALAATALGGAGALAPASEPAALAPAGTAGHCGRGSVSAALSWGHKCLRGGQFCRVKGDREYHRYRFHCHTGRLSRSPAGGNEPGDGCQPGYSPCLPRAADLNCDDIPADKKPVRVTGDDPYRLDADGDGIACTATGIACEG